MGATSVTGTGPGSADGMNKGSEHTTLGANHLIGSTSSDLTAEVAANTSAIALKAPLASPALTGTPTAPTATTGTNTTQIATTAFVLANAGSGGAPLASPAFTGTPTAPTATTGTNTTQIATTAFVLANGAPLASPAFTGTPTAPTATVGTNTTQIATTAFVLANAGGGGGGATLGANTFTATQTISSGGLVVPAGNITQKYRQVWAVSRPIAGVLGATTQIGHVDQANGAETIRITIVGSDSSYSLAKYYIIPVQYVTTTAAWAKALPVATTGPYTGAADFDLEVLADAGTLTMRLRNSSTAGSTPGTCYVVIEQDGISGTFTETTTAATGLALPTVTHLPSIVTGVNPTMSDAAAALFAPSTNFEYHSTDSLDGNLDPKLCRRGASGNKTVIG